MAEIYDQLGGPDGVRTAVEVFYNRIASDEELGRWFDAMVSTLLTSLADLGVAKDAVGAVGERLEVARADIVTG